VFLDCLSLRPGEKWKDKLRDEIKGREIFWLFWSRSAMKSEWVKWEWQTGRKVSYRNSAASVGTD
jgi:TIR domain